MPLGLIMPHITASQAGSLNRCATLDMLAISELTQRVIVFPDQIVRDEPGVVRAETLQPFKFQFDEFAAHLDLRCTARRKDQVADVLPRLQHRCDELRRLNASLSGGCLRCCTHEISQSPSK